MPRYTEARIVTSPSQQVRFTESGPAAQPTSDPESGHVEEESEEPRMSTPVAIGLLVVVTVVSLLTICARDRKTELDGPCSSSLSLQSG